MVTGGDFGSLDCDSQGEALPRLQEGVLEVSRHVQLSTGLIDTSPWWAVYTRHQHERSVAETLTLKGFETFLPVYDSTRQWKDRKKVISLPLFPCYVFVRGDLDRKLQVVTTPGIHMILYRGQQVAEVSREEILAIQKAVSGPYRVEPHPFLKCGSRVRVTGGPLEGVEGILLRKKNMFRLVLSVQMLAQSVSVEVNASDLEPCRTDKSGGKTQLANASMDNRGVLAWQG